MAKVWEQGLQLNETGGFSDGEHTVMAVADISFIPTFGPKSEYVNAIIEAPKGSRIKFKYDEDQGLFMFDKLLPIGQSFPFDFGFIPGTLAEDGDPLDILVLTEEPAFVGCLIHAKLLGVIEAEQTQDGKTERNDRLIAVPLDAKFGKPVGNVAERVTAEFANEIAKFFIAYNQLQEKEFKILRCGGPSRAKTLAKKGIENFAGQARHKKSA